MSKTIKKTNAATRKILTADLRTLAKLRNALVKVQDAMHGKVDITLESESGQRDLLAIIDSAIIAVEKNQTKTATMIARTYILDGNA